MLKLVEARKFYPKLARRKNIQGTVKVSFTIACDGNVSGLDTAESHKLLRKAAAKAVRAAQPLPKPPGQIDCPLPVQFAIDYSLK